MGKISYSEYSEFDIVLAAATVFAALAREAKFTGRRALDRVDGVTLLVDNVESSSADTHVLVDRAGKLTRWTPHIKLLNLVKELVFLFKTCGQDSPT